MPDIQVTTKNPAGLLTAMKDAISNHKIRTWICDSDGDFTHNTSQFLERAWLQPGIKSRTLNFKLVCASDETQPVVLAGIYVGRFIEMLCGHFADRISQIDTLIVAPQPDTRRSA